MKRNYLYLILSPYRKNENFLLLSIFRDCISGVVSSSHFVICYHFRKTAHLFPVMIIYSLWMVWANVRIRYVSKVVFPCQYITPSMCSN